MKSCIGTEDGDSWGWGSSIYSLRGRTIKNPRRKVNAGKRGNEVVQRRKESLLEEIDRTRNGSRKTLWKR